MSNASRGHDFERDVRALLEAAGFAVTRGAGSKGHFDTPEGVVKPDLIASKRGRDNKYEIQIVLLQCKVKGI